MERKQQFVRRKARSTVSFARRRPVTFGIGIFGFAIFAITGVGEALLGTASEAASGGVATQSTNRAADLISMFDARSPGSRRYGWLVQTKQPRTGFDVGPPFERVLTTGRRRPSSPDIPSAVPPIIPYIPVGDVFDNMPPVSIEPDLPNTVGPVGFGSGFGPTAPVVGGVLPGPGGGSNNGNTPGSGDTGVTPLPAVPEPATWAMFIAGFFGIGAAMRRRPVFQLRGTH